MTPTPSPVTANRRERWLHVAGVAIVLAALLLVPVATRAQNYLFSVPSVGFQVFVQPDGSAGRVYALDTEPDMIAYLEERGRREMWRGVEPRLVEADDPALGEAQVDRILVVDTWHHLPDRAGYARKLARALRAGGRLAVVDFTPEAPMGPPPAMRLSAEAVVAELTAAALVAEIAAEELPHQYVVVAVRPTP